MEQWRFMFNKLQVLAGLNFCWEVWGGLDCLRVVAWGTVSHMYTNTRTHTHHTELISAVRVYSNASICTAALRLEKQSYLCTYFSNGFMWLSATPVWQHTACQRWTETNGKANIWLISKDGRNVYRRSVRRLTAAINSPPSASLHLSAAFYCDWQAVLRE